MSRYLVTLETHLSPAQNAALAAIAAAATQADLNLFVSGATMRDVLAGLRSRDLELVVEGLPSKLASDVAESGVAEHTASDEVLKSAELTFPSGVTAHIRMAAEERYPKPGGKPKITPASIHDHLRSRDFSVNSIALSVTRASRGLLIDPNNGMADISNRELRVITGRTLYDQPARLLELIRLRVRLDFAVYPRTQSQFEEALEAGVLQHIRPQALLAELRRTALEPKALEILQAEDEAGLLGGLLPYLSGPRLNVHGFAKLQKAHQAVPFGIDTLIDDEALFFWALTEKLTPKERAAFMEATGAEKEFADRWLRLDKSAAKVEKELTTGSVHKPSQVYRILSKHPLTIVLFVLTHSASRPVQDRVRNYLTKFLPSAMEVADADVPVVPGSAKFEKMKADIIAKKLDARPKKPPAEEADPAAVPAV